MIRYTNYLIFLIIFQFSASLGYAQGNNIASVFKKTQEEFNSKNYSRAIFSGQQGLEIAKEENNIDYVIKFNLLLSESYLAKQNFAKAIQHYINNIYQLEKIDINKDQLAESYYLLGKVYMKMGASKEADRCFQEAIKNFDASGDQLGKINSMQLAATNSFEARDFDKVIQLYEKLFTSGNGMIGNEIEITKEAYENMLRALLFSGEFEKGIRYGEQYERISRNWNIGKTEIWNLLGKLYRDDGQYDKAIIYAEKSLEIDPKNIIYNLNLAETYFAGNRIEDALSTLNFTVDLTRSNKDHATLAKAFNLMATIYFIQKNNEETLFYLEGAQKIANNVNDFEELKKVYSSYITLYTELNDEEKITKYEALLEDVNHQLSIELTKSMKSVNFSNEFASNFEKSYRDQLSKGLDIAASKSNDIRERTIQIQESEKNEIEQNLQITKQLLANQEIGSELDSGKNKVELSRLQELESEQELELSRKERMILQQQYQLQEASLNASSQRQFLLLSIVVISMVAVIFLVFLMLRITKSRKVIAEQNKVLENKQKEIRKAHKILRQSLANEQNFRKKLQKSNGDLKSAQSKLIHAEKMSSLGQLTAGIVHEINNPVNFVKGGLETLDRTLNEILNLLEKAIDAKQNEKLTQKELNQLYQLLREELDFAYEELPSIVKDMRFGTNRIEEIVNGLRIFSRQKEAKPNIVNVHDIIDSALLILKAKTAPVSVIEKHYDKSVDEIECFAGQLNQVFVNLISNSVDAMVKGKIVITTKNLGDSISISIKDDGAGMPQKVIDHIFEPFYTTKDVGKGTGLGLSISYSIIEKHKGEISVASEVGKGTEFTILLRKSLNLEFNQQFEEVSEFAK